MAESVRERILEATYACVARYGLGKTTVEDAAREARLSRATVYRHFPGGRDQLIGEVIQWEVARFFTQLHDAVAGTTDLRTMLVDGLMFAHKAVEEHEVLQKVLQTEPDRLLPALTVAANRVLVLIRAILVPYLDPGHLRPGVEPEQAADYLARLILSFIGTQGAWDLTKRAEVEELVDRELLVGIA